MSNQVIMTEQEALRETRELYQRLHDLENRVLELEQRQKNLERDMPEPRISIVVMSGDYDRVLAAFVIATGAAAMGLQVSMFFTFWGLGVLRQNRRLRGKGLLEKAFTLLTPAGAEELSLSRLNFAGLGLRLLKRQMRQRNISSLSELIAFARDLGVRMVACQMSMDVMGIKPEELQPGLETGGVATFLADATKSKATLFI
jgi:peroxiredoxin family protein